MSSNLSIPSSSGTAAAVTTSHVLRWSTANEKAIERLEAARLQQKERASLSSTTTIAPVDKYRNYPHFLGILHNHSLRPDQLKLVYKNVEKVTKGEPMDRKYDGLLIPDKHFESSNTILIVVYLVSETVARDFKFRLTKKLRKRQSLKAAANKNRMNQDRMETNGSSSSNVDNVIDLVPFVEQEENAMQVDRLPETAAATAAADVERIGDNSSRSTNRNNNNICVIQVEATPRIFVPFNNDWRPFDPNVGLPTGTIKYNSSIHANWPLDHPIEKISKLDKTKKAEAMKLLKKAILDHRTQGSKNYSDLDVKLGLPSFADNVESLNKILLGVVEFHMKFKAFHMLMRSCLQKWIAKESEQKKRRQEKRDRIAAEKEKRRQEKVAAGPTPTETSIEMVEEICLDGGEGSGEGRKRKRVPSRGDNNSDKSGPDAIPLVDLRENTEVEMVDLTADTPSTECSLSPIPHGTPPISQSDRLIPVAPRIVSQSEGSSDASTNEAMRSGSTLYKRPRLLVRGVTVDSASSQNTFSIPTTKSSHHSQSQSHASHATTMTTTTTTGSSAFTTSSLLRLSGSTTPSQLRQNQKVFVCKKLQDTISEKCILSTLSQILWMSGADKLLGSKSNVKGFLQFVRKAVFLGGLQCELRLSYLMTFLSSLEGKCAWMDEGGIDNELVRRWLLAKVGSWLFQQYILIILRTGFYVTELSDSRNQMAFYLRDTWVSVTEKMKSHYLKKKKLILLPQNSSPQQGTGMSSGKLRFVPKKNNTVRPILQYDSKFKKKTGIKDAKRLLDYMSSKVAPHEVRDPALLHVKWRKFVAEWKEAGHPKLYFVRTDIADAFPSVNLIKLEKVLYECQSEDELFLRHYIRVMENKSRKKYFFVGTKTDPDPQFVQNRQWTKYSNDGVAEPFRQREALEFIKTALDPYIIHIGKHHYQFRDGLPQGSSLSQPLANIYYGSMDQEYFAKFLNVTGELFVRKVDDYFFVTPDPLRAMELYDLMMKGNKAYAFNTNKKKTQTNLLVRSDLDVNSDDTLHGVMFNGWRFCLLTGHVTRDFSAYAGLDIVSTLSFKSKKNNETPESFIHRRLLNVSPLWIWPVMMDPAINCRRRIFMNVMQAGLMVAFRFYAMCRTLYTNVLKISPAKSRLLFMSLCACAARLTRFVLSFRRQYLKAMVFHNCSNESPCDTGKAEGRRVPKIFRKPSSVVVPESSSTVIVTSNGCDVTETELLFVIFHAFIVKLSKHQAVFQTDVQNGILPFLGHQRKKYQMKIPWVIVDEILSAVGTILPPSFAAMKK